jgi:hypothetical protein
MIIAFSNIYNMDDVKRLTQIYKNNISVSLSFLPFVSSFQPIKSQKNIIIFFMMFSVGLYYNHYVVEPLGHELRTNMNTNALKIVPFQFVYLSFLSFIASLHHTKSPKCSKLF